MGVLETGAMRARLVGNSRRAKVLAGLAVVAVSLLRVDALSQVRDGLIIAERGPQGEQTPATEIAGNDGRGAAKFLPLKPADDPNDSGCCAQ